LKVTNLLQLTEHHKYIAVRRFGLSPLDLRMLWTVYQPMIGGFAVSLYTALYAALDSEAVGSSAPKTLGQLFLACGLEPNEQGRKRLVDETSKLEAVGLLQTFRKKLMEEVVEYEFRLEPPLTPDQFFGVHHLWLLLQEKLGPAAAEALRRSFVKESFEEWGEEEGVETENISAPFYEVYRVSLPAAGDSETDLRTDGQDMQESLGRDGFRPEEMLQRFPRSSPNRRAVELLTSDAEKLAKLNYIALRCGLTLKQTVSLLDEDGQFGPDGEWLAEQFQKRAVELYRQSNSQARRKEQTLRKQQIAGGAAPQDPSGGPASAGGGERAVPESHWLPVPEQFQGQCDARQYNTMLANMPYSQVLKLFFAPAEVPVYVEEAFMAMNLDYQLPDEVLNVMVHYIRTNDLDWRRSFLEAIAANVAGKRIRSFENAVLYFHKEEQARTRAAAGKGARKPVGTDPRKGRPAAKPVIPVVRPAGKAEATEEDIKRIMEMAERLKNG